VRGGLDLGGTKIQAAIVGDRAAILGRSRHETPTDGGPEKVATELVQALRDAAEDAGVLMPSGCRMGICYGCVLPMREGAVRDLRTGEVTVAAPGETATGGVPIQTCISAAAGACDLDH